ncbi:MAG TPA: nucleotidyltransferase family protein [Vicinamibacterales bacterium]|jgi:putative nucleotidyltransferase-like protein|nr:nucleotidyltransferase family protein [Vicinamibacterales bacterium]
MRSQSRVRQMLDREVPPRSVVARELIRAHEITHVLDALAARKVFPILLKGAALAYTVYPSPAMRPRVDTDLLVARDHIAVVRDVLSRRGYVEPPMTDGELVLGQMQMLKVDAFDVEHVFDIHWRISSQTLFADLLTYEELQIDCLGVPALGAHARTASDSHALLLACVHPVMHHHNTDRLIWFSDIDLLARRLPGDEFRGFARLALTKKVTGICLRQLTIAEERFHTPIPSDVMDMLTSSPAEPTAVYLRPHRRWHHELLWNIRNLRAGSDRLQLLREVLFPSARYMLDAYHVGARGVVLLPALYVHRCAYGAFKILTGRK